MKSLEELLGPKVLKELKAIAKKQYMDLPQVMSMLIQDGLDLRRITKPGENEKLPEIYTVREPQIRWLKSRMNEQFERDLRSRRDPEPVIYN